MKRSLIAAALAVTSFSSLAGGLAGKRQKNYEVQSKALIHKIIGESTPSNPMSLSQLRA